MIIYNYNNYRTPKFKTNSNSNKLTNKISINLRPQSYIIVQNRLKNSKKYKNLSSYNLSTRKPSLG